VEKWIVLRVYPGCLLVGTGAGRTTDREVESLCPVPVFKHQIARPDPNESVNSRWRPCTSVAGANELTLWMRPVGAQTEPITLLVKGCPWRDLWQGTSRAREHVRAGLAIRFGAQECRVDRVSSLGKNACRCSISLESRSGMTSHCGVE